MTPAIRYEKGLLEEFVFLAVKTAEENGQNALSDQFHQNVSDIYDQHFGVERESAFCRFYENMFDRLGFAGMFEKAVSSYPAITASSIPILVRRVWNQRSEGVELYVRPDFKIILIGIRTVKAKDCPALAAFLDHELMHVSDMLDPAFCYRTDRIDGSRTEVEQNLIRDRFGLLWNWYVSVRLVRGGKAPLIPVEALEAEINRLTPDISLNLWKNRLLKGGCLTQEDLLASAAGAENHRRLIGEGGRLCPLCGFSSFDVYDFSAPGAETAVACIGSRRPGWKPSEGACRQCVELYQNTGMLIPTEEKHGR